MCNRITKCVPLAGLLVLSVVYTSGHAAFNRELVYIGSLEAHSEEPDETLSFLGLALWDDRSWSNYTNVYELRLGYEYEHRGNESNEGVEGFYYGTYQASVLPLAWAIDADFTTLPEESGEEIDNLSSQTLTTVSTGPTYYLFRDYRYTTEITALVSAVDYSDEVLDSTQESATLRHAYLLSENNNLTFELNLLSVEFDDSVNASSDFDADNLNIVYESESGIDELRIRLGYTELENVSNPSDQEEFELNYEYRINPRSILEFEIADSLQSSADFNRESLIENNAIFTSSLIRNQRISLDYSYRRNQDLYEVGVFSNQVELVFGDRIPQDIVGASAGFTRRVGSNWIFYIEVDVADNDILVERFESLDAGVSYRRQHTRKIESFLGLSVEADNVDNESAEDYIFFYRLAMGLGDEGFQWLR